MIITVNSSVKYDIILGEGILSHFGKTAAELFGSSKVVIVTDNNVAKNYLESLSNSLKTAGFQVYDFIIEAGEGSKNMQSFERLVSYLCELSINKGDLLVALGGGVVSDLTGFVASCYLRGMPYATVATSFLAAVDASIGGKTAIDHAGQKNNVGSFYPPHLVMIDTELFKTLPSEELQNGLVEAIKSGALLDEALFEKLSIGVTEQDYQYIIERSLLVKRHYVEQDEKDNGLRQLLNLGHTLGHAIEAQSGYNISHGVAVAAGMVSIIESSEKMGLTKNGVTERIKTALAAQGVEYSMPYKIDDLLPHLAGDKKMRKSSLTLALLKDIAQPFLHKIDIKALDGFFKGDLHL